MEICSFEFFFTSSRDPWATIPFRSVINLDVINNTLFYTVFTNIFRL